MATETLRPDDQGDEENIPAANPDVDHHLNVDEVSQDARTTYIYCPKTQATWVRDLYSTGDSGVGAGTINGITVGVYAETADATPDQTSLKIACKTGGTAYEGSEETLTTDFALYTKEWANNPGGGAWTWVQIDALQIGASIRQCHSGAPGGGGSVITQVYVVVDYTPAGYAGGNIEGVAAASIGGIDGVATANIAKVDGI